MSRKLAPENETFTKFANFPKPTVAAIEGYALGGGMELAAGADIIVVGENSKFGVPEINLGAIPGSGGTVRITRRIGIGRVSELFLLGDMIDAQQALAWGYANHIKPKGEVLAHAQKLAARLASAPKQAICAASRRCGMACTCPRNRRSRSCLTCSMCYSVRRTSTRAPTPSSISANRIFNDPLDTSKFVGCMFPK